MKKSIIDKIIQSAEGAGYVVRTPYGVSRAKTPSYGIGKDQVGTLAIVSREGEIVIMDSCSRPQRSKLLEELEAQFEKDNIPYKRTKERQAEAKAGATR